MADTFDRNRDSFEFDALAELFLGDDGQPTRKAPNGAAPANGAAPNGRHVDVVGSIGLEEEPRRMSAPRTTFVEALVVGHLPVRTGPWLAQYASGVAKAEHGPVALARLADGEIRIDAIGAATRPEPVETLEEAIAASPASRWMIQVGDLDVPWLLRSPLVEAITLLAGGNEAALVDAYRTIKTLVSSGHSNDTADDAPSPAIRLAIMGADEDRARAVADRLRDASRAFLGREIELAAAIKEMGPTGSAALHRGRTELDVRAILELIRRGAARTPNQTPVQPSLRRPESPTSTPAPTPAEVKTRPVAPARMPGPGTTPPVQVPAHAPATHPAPSARPATGTARPTRAPSHSLSSHLEALDSLAIPYPDDARVEFAIDADACLHILRMDDDRETGAVSSLTGAAAWAVRHLALINMAIAPSGPLRPDAAPILHLFTRHPKMVRPLLDAAIRVHALAPVRQDRAWVSVDLN